MPAVRSGPSSSTPTRTLRLHRDRFPGRPVFDTAVSHAMLRRVAAGAAPESLRLYVPEDIVLFSSLDQRRPGYERALEIARSAGFEAVIRLAGGHAAAFLSQSIAFAWALPEADARGGIRPRFERLATLVVRALSGLGLDARIGELPGEYCPGEYSVNVGGVCKVMGVGQRVIRGGAHVGGVITVGRTQLLREILIRVYEALDLELRPETVGGLADLEPGIEVEDVVRALVAVFEEEGCELEPTPFEADTLAAAEALMAHHEPTRATRRADALATAGGKTLVQVDRLARPRAGQSPESE